ncbi:MAG TPA: long-chain fatty acid--CoA ligase [Myxococcota bacterium]|nr:long-chain fatty acid--CoA ligase [Myxococcota bacterium]
MSESVATLFDESVKRFHKRPAIQYFCIKSSRWVTKNWLELSKSVGKLANALSKDMTSVGDRVAILSQTRPEWVISDIAIMKTACVVVPIYHSSLSDQLAYILKDASAQIILVENEIQLKKVRQVQDEGVFIRRVIIFDPVLGTCRDNEVYLRDYTEGQPDIFATIKVNKEELASLVYTSGTTGEPKGAMISHDNLLYEAQAIDKLGILSHEDVQLIFLPLAHIFARVLEASWIRTGHLLAFAESIEKVVDNMAEIRPTFMAGVPRIFEKVRARAMETALAKKGLAKKIAAWAFLIASKKPSQTRIAHFQLLLAQRLVFDKIGKKLNKRFGGRLRFLVSGGAALPSDVSSFFRLCGILLCEGYGLTETTAATCLNLPWAWRENTVGRTFPGTELRLGPDHEIMVRGRGVFLGFWNKPKETKEVFNADGWFLTGDIGEIDEDGYVKIVDRKKDIIITSQGKNVAPQRVESLIKSKSHCIAYAVIIGERKPYLTALIALEHVNAEALVNAANKKNPKINLVDLSVHPLVYQEIKNAIADANAMLPSFEQIKRFHILPNEFKIGVELTPTLKAKRKLIADKYARDIQALYA